MAYLPLSRREIPVEPVGRRLRGVTPIGHAAVSLVAGRPGRLDPRALVLGGILPDLDWLLFWAPGFNAWHRVATHNVAFVIVGSLLAVALARRWLHGPSVASIGAVMLGAALHVLVDACMDTNPSNGIGVALLWPLSEWMWSPFNVMAFEDNPAGWSDPLRAAPGVLRGVPWELPFVLLAGWLWWPRRRSDRA